MHARYIVGKAYDMKTKLGLFSPWVWSSSPSTGTSNLKVLARFLLLNWEEQCYEGNVGVTASSPHSKCAP